MKCHHTDGDTLYPACSAAVREFSDLLDLPYPSTHFVLLIAADFAKTPTQEIIEITKQLIGRGLACVCTWGPGCEAAHDAFDLANVLWEEETGKELHVMSSWHSRETLEEALWFALYAAFVDDEIAEDTTTVCVSVSNPEWHQIIDQALDDLPALNERVLSTRH
ncbi:MAG TPA: hypothetical protein VIL43_06535 [Burkholderiales bacterium]